MLENTINFRVYLACGNTDMRKSIDGLALIVQEVFLLDPFSDSLFVFCNKNKDKIKILRWDTNGFWLYYKRLEKEKFKWPKNTDSDKIKINTKQLNWLLDGLELEQKLAHKQVTANMII
jgi:transposase